jgi:uroporphyrinogen decarboxylase
MSTRTSPTHSASAGRRFLAPFRGEVLDPPPIWLMRQAGRYLPEYREVRAKAGGFLDLCYTPALAAEVTLQPIRRYGFDAAILFSDILVVPDALGQPVSFLEGEGPRLDPIRDATRLARLDPSQTHRKFDLVYETVQRLRAALPHETALIGFCGAPWTVATYMVAGSGSPDQAEARSWAYRDPDGFGRLVDLVTETSIDYLSGQVRAGADVLQIFDSWSGTLPDSEFAAWVIAPTVRIVTALRERHPGIPIIGFARGAGLNAIDYAAATGVDALGCDTSVPLRRMREAIAPARTVLQGNLDPMLLVLGGASLDRRIDQICDDMRGHPFIFNLGHGIVPETPPDHVAHMVDRVRAAR